MAELVVDRGKSVLLRPEGMLIGRRSDDGSFSPDLDLAALEGGRTVSRRHARVFARDGQWFLQVETPTNETLVGGRTLKAGEQTALKDGDEITLGKITVVFRAESELATARSVGMAELRSEGRAFPLSAPEGSELTLGRHSDDKTYQPDVDLGDLPSGRTVSRRHGLLYYRGDQWFLRVQAEVTNPTLLDGRRLELNQEVPLKDGNQIQLGRVIVTFHQLTEIQQVDDELVELKVEPALVDVEPGSEETAVITIVNHTGHVDWFRIEVEGIPESWYKVILPDGTTTSPAQVRLFHTAAHASPAADAVAQLRLVYAPPRECASRARAYPLVISATTQGEPHVRRVTTGQLTVKRFEQMEMTLGPEEVSKPGGDFVVDLHNAGNDVAQVRLTPEGDGLIFAWAGQAGPVEKSKFLPGSEDIQQVAPVAIPGLPQRKAVAPDVPVRELQMGNCAQDQAKLAVKVRRRHWLGTDRIYSFSVTANAGSEEIFRRGRLICPPRIPIWLQTAYQRVQSLLAPVLILIALLGMAWAFGRPADIKDFKAQPGAVIVGTPVALSWSLDRASSVSIEPASGTEQLSAPEGNLTVSPAQTTRYTLTARNRLGIPTSRTVNVEVRPAPVLPHILAFTASVEHIKKEGEAVTLRWETDSATKVSIEPADEVKDLATSGEAIVHPSQASTTYKLIATNAAGTKEATKTIVVDPPQVTSFTASPETVVQGGEVKLKWAAQGYSKLVIKSAQGDILPNTPELVVPAGATEQAVRPLADTEYTITATNAGGADAKTVKVSASPMKIGFFKADKPTIAKGESATLSWSVEGAKSVKVEPEVGDVAQGQNSASVSPQQTTEYTLTAVGADGKPVQAKLTVTVGLGAAKIDFFTAARATIAKGDQVTLTYSVQNAKRIVIQTGDGKVLRDAAVDQPSVKGSVTDTPDKPTTYILTVSNDSGQTATPFAVDVQQPTPTPAPTAAPPAAPPAAPAAPPAQPKP